MVLSRAIQVNNNYIVQCQLESCSCCYTAIGQMGLCQRSYLQIDEQRTPRQVMRADAFCFISLIHVSSSVYCV